MIIPAIEKMFVVDYPSTTTLETVKELRHELIIAWYVSDDGEEVYPVGCFTGIHKPSKGHEIYTAVVEQNLLNMIERFARKATA